MNYYETLYIVHPALESGRLKDIILSLEDSLKNLGGKPLSIKLWGKKRLAYFIDKQKYGTYVQFQFTGKGNCTSSFGMELEHNPNILSYLTTLIEETDIVEQENDLDTQIAGQSREAQRINNLSANVAKKTSSEDAKPVEKDESQANNMAVESKDESVSSIEEAVSISEIDVDDLSNKSKSEEKDELDNNIDSVEENQENANETTTASEEE